MLRIFIFVAAISILIVGLPMTIAQETAQQVTVTYTNDAITLSSAEVSSGLTTFVMDNQSDAHTGGPIGRFKDGMTMDDFVAAASESRFAPILVFDLYGSLSGLPGAEESITLNLESGNYVFLGGNSLMGTLTVTSSDSETIAAPEHDVNVVMVDFAFGTQSVIPAGEQLWRIRNEGEQIHEFLIIPVEEGTTTDEAITMFRSMGDIFNVMAGASPINPLKIWGPISPDKVAWAPIALDPGTYALGTLLPDVATLREGDAPMLQIDHGMVRIFTVE